ncbi:hypothetical protein LX32DRAFT_407691 [Colletotrichum zoysiae]|uniref:Uncharacterized protein n=1 Tax=Colletotrichum zoysiae TaxID=1216348 RepID=A0AAD9HH28_9PEZI|nr:hypothetical protein LX32DRAFT_407691 [Colletotrichum zoysiae]
MPESNLWCSIRTCVPWHSQRAEYLLRGICISFHCVGGWCGCTECGCASIPKNRLPVGGRHHHLFVHGKLRCMLINRYFVPDWLVVRIHLYSAARSVYPEEGSRDRRLRRRGASAEARQGWLGGQVSGSVHSIRMHACWVNNSASMTGWLRQLCAFRFRLAGLVGGSLGVL